MGSLILWWTLIVQMLSFFCVRKIMFLTDLLDSVILPYTQDWLGFWVSDCLANVQSLFFLLKKKINLLSSSSSSETDILTIQWSSGAGPLCCSDPPILDPHSGAGHVEKLGGLPTYVIGSPYSKHAAVLISDVYGNFIIILFLFKLYMILGSY